MASPVGVPNIVSARAQSLQCQLEQQHFGQKSVHSLDASAAMGTAVVGLLVVVLGAVDVGVGVTVLIVACTSAAPPERGPVQQRLQASLALCQRESPQSY